MSDAQGNFAEKEATERNNLDHQIEKIAEIVCFQREIHSIDVNILRRHGAIGLAYNHCVSSLLKASLKSAALEQIASEKIRSINTSEVLCKLQDDFQLDFIVFKGGALAYQLYNQSWLRPRTDTDILVPLGDQAVFIDAMESLKMQKKDAIEGSQIAQQMSFGKLLNGRSTINLDIHWKISNRHSLANVFEFNELYSKSSSFNMGSYSFRSPSDAHALLLACIHRSGHHYNEERFTWLYDIHLLCSTLTNDDWNQVLELTKKKGISAITLDALNRCSKLLETNVPAFVIKELRDTSTRRELSSKLIKDNLAGWEVLENDLKALPSIKKRIQFLWQTAFPPATYMKRKYGSSWLVLNYLKRAMTGLKKMI